MRNFFGKFASNETEGKQLKDLKIQISGYGETTTNIHGTVQISGNIIWAIPLKEVKDTIEQDSKVSKSGVQSISREILYPYYATFAIGLREGKIDKILRIWANDNPVNLSEITHRIYKGDEEQEPDFLISSVERHAPGYSGLAYIVIENFCLADYSNKMPNFTFEIQKDTASTLPVKGINIIPGSGEFVYDTIVQSKAAGDYSHTGEPIQKEPFYRINKHTYSNLSDAIVSLNHLQNAFPQLEWVSVVFNWFIGSLDISTARIYPAVELHNMIFHPDK